MDATFARRSRKTQGKVKTYCYLLLYLHSRSNFRNRLDFFELLCRLCFRHFFNFRSSFSSLKSFKTSCVIIFSSITCVLKITTLNSRIHLKLGSIVWGESFNLVSNSPSEMSKQSMTFEMTWFHAKAYMAMYLNIFIYRYLRFFWHRN